MKVDRVDPRADLRAGRRHTLASLSFVGVVTNSNHVQRSSVVSNGFSTKKNAVTAKIGYYSSPSVVSRDAVALQLTVKSAIGSAPSTRTVRTSQISRKMIRRFSTICSDAGEHGKRKNQA